MDRQDLHQQFASDNCAAICPEAWDAMCDANKGHAASYGDDSHTSDAIDAVRRLFELDCEVFFLFNGTAANALALASLCRPYEAAICSDLAHVRVDECGAPAFFGGGTQLLPVRSTGGKIDSASVAAAARARSDIHAPKPRAVTITQSTEAGLAYTASEVREIGEACRDLGLRLHMDGARFANACASLESSPADLTWRAGVEVLSLGGTKNGMGLGEAVVFFDPALAQDFAYRCKQGAQVASKMRYLSAPWARMLDSGGWLTNARQANHSAARFAASVTRIPGVELAAPVQANAVFIRMPEDSVRMLRDRGWRFHTHIAGAARFMFAWDTRDDSVDALLSDIRAAMQVAAA